MESTLIKSSTEAPNVASAFLFKSSVRPNECGLRQEIPRYISLLQCILTILQKANIKAHVAYPSYISITTINVTQINDNSH